MEKYEKFGTKVPYWHSQNSKIRKNKRKCKNLHFLPIFPRTLRQRLKLKKIVMSILAPQEKIFKIGLGG